MIKRILLFILIFLVSISLIFIFVIGGGFGNKKQDLKFPSCNDSLMLFAHRGITKYYPENSLQGFNAARELGFCAVEIDLRQTKDNEFVLIHDFNCKRLLDTNALVSGITLKQLKKYPILFNSKKTSNHVLTLNEFLNEFKNDYIIYLDVKLDKEKTKFDKADKIVEIIHAKDIVNNVIVANADFIFIAYIEYIYPEIMTALEGFKHDKEWIYNVIPTNFKPDFLSSSYKDFSHEEIPFLKKNDLLSRRIIYHVNSENLQEYLDMGATKIIFDYDSTSDGFLQSVH
ncbi:glycerophosphodiester phosphodiesterase [Bacteroidota bacterium]